MSSSRRGRLFIISGPSGAGKSTVLNMVFRELKDPCFSVSATTRLPRPGERDGVDYHFITREKFLNMIENGEFLEYAQYVGNYYGTPVKPITDCMEAGRDVFVEVDVQGFLQIKQKMSEAISIFVSPPDLKSLENRLRSRNTEAEETVRNRLEIAEREMALAQSYDYLVINDVAARAAGEILSIIQR